MAEKSWISDIMAVVTRATMGVIQESVNLKGVSRSMHNICPPPPDLSELEVAIQKVDSHCHWGERSQITPLVIKMSPNNLSDCSQYQVCMLKTSGSVPGISR